MKRTIAIVSILGGMVLGATVLRDLVPNSEAQTAQSARVAPQTPSTTAQSTTTQSSAFNQNRALLENEKNSIETIKNNQNGVVFVTVESKPEVAQGSSRGQTDPFGQFFGQGQGLDLQPEPRSGSGSGFFVNDAGYILTNYHVVEGADTITIKLHSDKTEYTAKVIGTAPDYDLALIKADKVPKNKIKAMTLGNSSALEPGRKVIAMGAPFGLDFTATEGIVSAVEREIPTGVREVPQTAIQTDAAINPGNSGGPLVNSSGEVIGINTQILSPGARQSSGVGFAIPINTAKNLLPRLEKGGQISTPTLGIQLGLLENLTGQQRTNLGDNLPNKGLYIAAVTNGSPAASAGLKQGDTIRQIDSQSVTESDDLRKYLFSKAYGDKVTLKIVRGGQEQSITVTLREYTPSN